MAGLGPIDTQRILSELMASFGATQANDVEQRASLLPIARYSDGKTHPAVPGMLAWPVEAAGRMMEGGTPNFVAEPEATASMARDSFDVAGGMMEGGLGAGLAGAVPEGGVAANGIGARIKGWLGKGEPAPAGKAATWGDVTGGYHELLRTLPDDYAQPLPQDGGAFSARMYRGSEYAPGEQDLKRGLYASSSPTEASGFAYPADGATPNVMPVDMEFKNPLIVDAGGADWSSVPFNGELRDIPSLGKRARKRGHDGLVVQNVREQMGSNGTTALAVSPGTVRSATTGDLLYSNSPTGASVPLAFNDYDEARQAIPAKIAARDAARAAGDNVLAERLTQELRAANQEAVRLQRERNSGVGR